LFALPRAATLRRAFPSMGTLVTLTIQSAPGRSRGEQHLAADWAQERLQDFAVEAWAWGRGALAQFNRALAAGRSAPVPASLRELFARAWSLHLATGGAYEPRIGALVRLWGFDDPARLRCSPPRDDEIATARAALRTAPPYDAGTDYGPAPGIAWDFGGIGKGFIADLLLDGLADRGFHDAVLDLGGNVSVRGRRRRRGWWIGIRDPRREDAPPLARLQVSDESVNTHADDQRGFEHDGVRYAHLLDPATGTPAHDLRQVTVIHADAALTEAGGCALHVAGAARWPALAMRLGLTQVLAMRDDGSLQVSAALLPRLELRTDVQVELV
jgi:thiamine biosynthesis lipoprotein